MFLYNAGLSYWRIEPFVNRLYEMIRQWFHQLNHLFEPYCQDRQKIAVDFDFRLIDGEEHDVWVTVDCDTLEVFAVEISPGRSILDALLFLKHDFERCRGRPLVRADHGPWYDWPIKLLNSEYEREKWGNRSLIEARFGVFKYYSRRFCHRFPFHSTAN